MEGIRNINAISKSKLVFMVLLAVLLLIQLARPQKNTSDSPAGKAFVDTFEVGEQVNAILAASCYDCHSNNTNYQWYSEIQPDRKSVVQVKSVSVREDLGGRRIIKKKKI